MRKVAPLGDEDHHERRQEWTPVAAFLGFDLDRLLGLGLLEVLPDQQPGHDEKENARADPHGFARKQPEDRAGDHGHQALHQESGGGADEHRDGAVTSGEQQGGQRRLIWQLDQKDDDEDGEAKTQRVSHRVRTASIRWFCLRARSTRLVHGQGSPKAEALKALTMGPWLQTT